MGETDSDWARKGANLNDKTACKEFGLTLDAIGFAIRAGVLRYRQTDRPATETAEDRAGGTLRLFHLEGLAMVLLLSRSGSSSHGVHAFQR